MNKEREKYRTMIKTYPLNPNIAAAAAAFALNKNLENPDNDIESAESDRFISFQKYKQAQS